MVVGVIHNSTHTRSLTHQYPHLLLPKEARKDGGQRESHLELRITRETRLGYNLQDCVTACLCHVLEVRDVSCGQSCQPLSTELSSSEHKVVVFFTQILVRVYLYGISLCIFGKWLFSKVIANMELHS